MYLHLYRLQVPLDHPDVGAVVISGSQLREINTDEEWDRILDHEVGVGLRAQCLGVGLRGGTASTANKIHTRWV